MTLEETITRALQTKRINPQYTSLLKETLLPSSFKLPKIAKSPQTTQFLQTALRKSLALSRFTAEQLDELIPTFKLRKIPKGKTLFHINSIPEHFYIVKSGEFHLFKADETSPAAVKSSGDCFGVISLLYNSKRNLECQNFNEPSEIFVCHRLSFLSLVFDAQSAYWIYKEEAFSQNVLSEHLSTKILFKLSKGEEIIKKNTIKSSLFLLIKGKVLLKDFGNEKVDFQNIDVFPGEFFGETEILHKLKERFCTAIALEDSKVLCVCPDAIQQVFPHLQPSLRLVDGTRFFQSVNLFKHLTDNNRRELFEMCSEIRLKHNQLIISQETVSNSLFFVKSGLVVSTKTICSNEKEQKLTLGGPGLQKSFTFNLSEPSSFRSVPNLTQNNFPSFISMKTFKSSFTGKLQEEQKRNLSSNVFNIHSGEFFLGYSEKSETSFSSKGSTFLFQIEKTKFSKFLDGLKKIQKDKIQQEIKRNWLRRQKQIEYELTKLLIEKKQLIKEELEEGKILGMGLHGVVKIVQHEGLKTVYALKKVKKKGLLKKDAHKGILRERLILKKIDFHLIQKMYKTFRDDYSVFFILEFIQGGEFFSLLYNQLEISRFFSFSDIKFYIACVSEALNYLHSKNIIYRDVKPENLMIDFQGYLKIVDFGSAKLVEKRTYSFVGTTQFLAPEIVLRKGYTKAVDHWALGVLTYEVIHRHTPFSSSQGEKYVYKNILDGRKNLKFSFDHIPGQNEEDNDIVKNFILQLLNSKPIKRIEGEINDQKFFEGFSFDKLHKRHLHAPWEPDLDSTDDTRYFSKEFGAEPEDEKDDNFPSSSFLGRTVGRKQLPVGWDDPFAEA
eukprot:snap_masked-scaffold_1-processed-gene-1.23-mRNA-1 protein AED:0.32 eAED:0.32 QI:0/0/0/0.5/1/1/2/0/835